MKKALIHLQDQHLRTVGLFKRLENHVDDTRDNSELDADAISAFLQELMIKGCLEQQVRACLNRRMPRHRCADCNRWSRWLLLPQSSVGTVLGEPESEALRHVRVFHSLKGTANAEPTFGLSYFNDLALVLRWLYADESEDARRCTDYELVDCLCRYVRHALCVAQGRALRNSRLMHWC